MVDSILQVKQTDIADLNDNWDLVDHSCSTVWPTTFLLYILLHCGLYFSIFFVPDDSYSQTNYLPLALKL